jgi:two-component system chemotaxis sensor kinase CheA
MDDLISEFITETSESLSVLDQELVKLEQNPNDKQILGNIFRLVHTVKGTCGFLGLPRLESVAHAGENVLGKIRDGELEVTPLAISLVLQALDCIKSIMEQLDSTGREPHGDDRLLIDQLNAFAEGKSKPATTPGPASTVSAPPARKVEVSTANMLSPDEIRTQAGGTADVAALDELERAFREAKSLDGMDFTKAPPTFIEETAPSAAASSPAAAAVVAPVSSKPDFSEQVKEQAIKQGLDTEAKDVLSGGAVAGQSIRVSLDVLEDLMQMVGELVLSRNQLMQIMRNRDDRELKSPLQQLSQITTELQDAVMKTRMQPISNAWAKFPRLIRDLSLELNKKIDLKMIGESTELDRQLLEMIKDPLTHMVRNSCDHGLENPAERKSVGKPETGTVTLSAYHEGGHIIIEIADDGRGINIERVKRKAIENRLASEEDLASMSHDQIVQFIFRAGFSTAEKVTSVSGRGVGMDVVRTNIEKIGGTIELKSTAGKGSTFHIKIPLTLAIVSVLLVESAGQIFGLPQLNVIELVRVDTESDFRIETINDSQLLRLRDKLLPLATLGELLGLPPAVKSKQAANAEEVEDAGIYIVVAKAGASDFGIIVDAVHDTEEIVVKPVNHLLDAVDVFSGNTILGDGSVIMILDPNGLGKAIGELDLSGRPAEPERVQSGERMGSFLLFDMGDDAPKAVPLELVSRLEEIKIASIEHSAGHPVVQYRGELMRLATLPGYDLPKGVAGVVPVIVFYYDGKIVGLVVNSIADIVIAPASVKLASHQQQFLGSIVIADKTTDVVDVGYILKEIAGDVGNLISGLERVQGVELLMVEDSVFFRSMAEPFLRALGYKVTSAVDGRAALDLLQTRRFDVMVTDIEMPELDGYQLATQIRQDARFATMPILAFSSTASETARQKALQSGMQEMILKTNREGLAVALAKHLARAKGEAA